MKKKSTQSSEKGTTYLHWLTTFLIAFGTLAVNQTSKWAMYEPPIPESLRRKMEEKFETK